MALPNSTADRERDKFQDVSNEPAWNILAMGGWIDDPFDEVVIYYDSWNKITQLFYKAATVTLVTLTFTYSAPPNNNLIKVLKS